MARQYKTFISGTLGNVIFYELKGTPVARSKPVKVRQTKATKASAKDFGLAAGYSKQVRDLLRPLSVFVDNRQLMYTFNRKFLQWIMENRAERPFPAKRLQSLLTIPLTDEILPSRVAKWKPKVSYNRNKILIGIPDLDPMDEIKAPKNTRQIELTFIAIQLHLDEDGKKSNYSPEQLIKIIRIPYQNNKVAASEFVLPFKNRMHNLAMLVMTTGYNIGDHSNLFPCRDRKWLNAEVLGVWKD